MYIQAQDALGVESLRIFGRPGTEAEPYNPNIMITTIC